MEKANCINICCLGSICSRWLGFASRRANLSVFQGQFLLPSKRGRDVPVHSEPLTQDHALLRRRRNAEKCLKCKKLGGGAFWSSQSGAATY